MNPNYTYFNSGYEKMKKRLNHNHNGLATAVAAAAVAVILCGCSSGAKFQDATVELGINRLRLEHFLREGAKAEKATFVTDMKSIALDEIGTHSVTLAYGSKEETVRLTIQDSTPPEVAFLEERTVYAGEELKPEDFVEYMEDVSGATAAFADEIEIPETNADRMITVLVTDGNGNQVEGQCRVSFLWMKEELVWEYGKKITKGDILYNAEHNAALLDQAELDRINQSGVGTYTLTSSTGAQCKVTVQDTKGPELKVLQAHTWPSEKVTVEDFVASAEDPSGVASVELLTQINIREKGVHPVQIRAVDKLGNETLAETTIKINLDHYDPVFEGLTDMDVEKNGTPDYETGITVTDNIDGEIGFTYDSSAVDVSKPGVYFVNYTAADEAGNETTARRRITVRPDEADIQALVEQIAADIPNDPKEIRNFAWKKIRYSASWGEPDAIWHGFTKWSGNCYVHALCLKALFDAKGYETHLIWTKDKTHYWVMVKLEEGWRHMDATPSEQHVRILYMTDYDRKATLDGRNWDRTLWPKAE